jgi:hypothetical protein
VIVPGSSPLIVPNSFHLVSRDLLPGPALALLVRTPILYRKYIITNVNKL